MSILEDKIDNPSQFLKNSKKLHNKKPDKHLMKTISHNKKTIKENGNNIFQLHSHCNRKVILILNSEITSFDCQKRRKVLMLQNETEKSSFVSNNFILLLTIPNLS